MLYLEHYMLRRSLPQGSRTRVVGGYSTAEYMIMLRDGALQLAAYLRVTPERTWLEMEASSKAEAD